MSDLPSAVPALGHQPHTFREASFSDRGCIFRVRPWRHCWEGLPLKGCAPVAGAEASILVLPVRALCDRSSSPLQRDALAPRR